MPTKHKRHYCIKCGHRKIAPRMIKVCCTKKRFGYDSSFEIHFCLTCADRFRTFLNGVVLGETLTALKSVAVAQTPKSAPDQGHRLKISTG